MKIVCGSCGAKYSIADEKVHGKVFKIRCRKCSNVIVVKGTAEAEASESNGADSFGSSSASSANATQEWYVVIDGEQAGPLSVDDVESYFIQGRITGESYIWRDGMADWSALFSVDAFMHLNNGGYDEDDATMIASSPLSQPQPAFDAGFDDMDGEDATAVVDTESFRHLEQFQQNPAPAADPFGAESIGFGSESFGQDSGYGQPDAGYGQPDAGFGQDAGYGQQDAGFGQDAGYAANSYQDSNNDYNSGGMDAGYGGGAGLASAMDPPASDDGMFAAFEGAGGGGFDNPSFNTGNGGFDNNGSLAYQSFAGLNGSNGADLDLGNATAPSASNGSGNEMIGQRNDNSVLFSLSSLQQVEAVSGPDTNNSANTEGSGLIDIQALASSHQQLNASRTGDAIMPTPETFSPGTMSVPAIMPARGSHRSNKGLIAGVVVAVVALLSVGIAAIVVIGGKNNNEQPQKVIVKEIIREKLIKDTSGNDAAKKAADDAAKKALAANTPPATDKNKVEDTKDDKEKTSKGSKRSKTSRKSKGSKKAVASDSPKKEVKKTPTKKKGGIDSIIGSLDTKKKTDTKKSEPKAEAKDLPKKLSKPQVQSTFRKYNGRVASCSKNKNSGKLSGTLWIRLSIQPAGKVSSASVASKSAKFKGTDVGRCVTGVVRSMRFPASQSPLSFSYPLILR